MARAPETECSERRATARTRKTPESGRALETWVSFGGSKGSQPGTHTHTHTPFFFGNLPGRSESPAWTTCCFHQAAFRSKPARPLPPLRHGTVQVRLNREFPSDFSIAQPRAHFAAGKILDLYSRAPAGISI